MDDLENELNMEEERDFLEYVEFWTFVDKALANPSSRKTLAEAVGKEADSVQYQDILSFVHEHLGVDYNKVRHAVVHVDCLLGLLEIGNPLLNEDILVCVSEN